MTKGANGGRKWWFIVPLITLSSLIFGVGGVAMAYRKDICSNSNKNVEQDHRITAHDNEIHVLDTSQARIDERLKSIDARQQVIAAQQMEIIRLLKNGR